MVRSTRVAAALAAAIPSGCGVTHSEGPPPPPVPLDPAVATAFLDTVQSRTFRYFWDLTNTSNGLTPDRAPTPSFSSIAAVGFALTAYPIGVERTYITRDEARQRVVTTLRFFWTATQDSSASGATGYHEAMILYILALGSPTHPVGPDAWTGWTGAYQWGTFYGQTHVGFAPLFGHHYSHVWIDFRGIRDAYMQGRGIDYFENSRRATFAQRAYAYANPGGWRGYSDRIWGLTASDGPGDLALTIDGPSRPFHSYWARGASFTENPDDGTIAPTAAGGSIPFAPEIAIPALYAMRHTYGDALFSTYGFRDAFNATFTQTSPAGWFDVDYLGIDQGPILAMAENYRTELIWRLMRGNAHIVRGLCRAGFTGGWIAGKCP